MESPFSAHTVFADGQAEILTPKGWKGWKPWGEEPRVDQDCSLSSGPKKKISHKGHEGEEKGHEGYLKFAFDAQQTKNPL